ncbi:AraC family transcriptional regulator [Marinoscillum furvescens]|uniref:AraC-like DNA-binding protein n=1 Tax=Marinoscillum furvescens DSM 4134 TaxID=1122208 RepID=A0A3D9L182_MARFU|nr:AraC family transcriptional regulator [Marinoscillum furvescens]RED95247.1 AraC-like DNA-binding protein [Marinoscillum furvescens DSM 4134]
MSINNLNLSLLHAGKVDLDHHWDFDNVISPFSRLYLITHGQAQVFHSGQTFDLKPGYLYLIPSYTYSRYKCESTFTQYYLSILEESDDQGSIFDHHEFLYEVPAHPNDALILDRILELNDDRMLLNDDPKAYDNVPTMLAYKARNDRMNPGSFLETRGLMTALLSRFIKGKKVTRSVSLKNQEKINNIIRYIRQNLHRELTVAELADEAHLNADYFSRVFFEIVKTRPVKFIQEKRIERAQLLLSTTTYSISEIAAKVGLDNISYFTRLFKKQLGRTPGAYRQSKWQNDI